MNTNQPPLNPDALEAAAGAVIDASFGQELPEAPIDLATAAVSAYLSVAQPVVTGEQVDLAGWTCDGIHEPGSYATCEDCREACDDLANFYNNMMQTPLPFKHWTGRPEVKA